MNGAVPPLPLFAFVAWRGTTYYFLCEQKCFDFPHTRLECNAVFSGINVPTFQRNLLLVRCGGGCFETSVDFYLLRRRMQQANRQQSLTRSSKVHGPRLIPVQSMWALWWTECHWYWCSSRYFSFPSQYRSTKAPDPISHINRLIYGEIAGVYCIV